MTACIRLMSPGSVIESYFHTKQGLPFWNKLTRVNSTALLSNDLSDCSTMLKCVRIEAANEILLKYSGLFQLYWQYRSNKVKRAENGGFARWIPQILLVSVVRMDFFIEYYEVLFSRQSENRWMSLVFGKYYDVMRPNTALPAGVKR